MKLTHKDNIRVEVEPGPYAYLGRMEDEEIVRDCKLIISNIERHVDDVQSCQIIWDTTYTCSFCGYEWEVDILTGEPLCCKEAIEEWEKGGE